MVTMKSLFFLALLGISLHGAAAVTHSWKAFYTGTTGLNEFPEFVALNVLDDEVMGYFDSKTNRFESKQSWMMENLGQQYEEQETDILRGHVPTFKANVAILMQRFNQSKGAHIFQWMYGCEWDDQTKEVNVFTQYGYDGEDFISFDLKSETWIAPKPQAVITKHKWDNDKADIAQWKNYITQICPEWLKKYVDYGRNSLLRTVLPSVSLLQKTPSSPVSCHATGFYPDGAEIFWRKDGEELHEDVDLGEILPNHDGSFQMSVDLKPPGSSEDWTKYECVFQLSGMKDDVVTRLDKAAIRTNEGKTGIRSDEENPIYMTVIFVVAVVVLVAIGVIGFFIYKKKNDTKTEGLMSDTSPTERVNSVTPLMGDMKTEDLWSDTSSTGTLRSESETSIGSADSDTQLIKDKSE